MRQFTSFNPEVFSSATAYERLTGRWSLRLAHLFVEFVRPQPAGRTLDVGCGTGSMVQAILDKHPRNEIVGIDLSSNFVEYSRARFPGARVTFDCGSALDLPYPDDSFDQTVSLLVLQFLADAARAASEMRRVTRPGGVVAACTWDAVGNERVHVFWQEQLRLDPEAEAHVERPRHYTRQGELARLWSETGLLDVAETMLGFRTDFNSFEDYWQPFLEGVGPIGTYVANLPREKRDALEDALRRRLLGERGNGLISLNARAWAVRGTVPC